MKISLNKVLNQGWWKYGSFGSPFFLKKKDKQNASHLMWSNSSKLEIFELLVNNDAFIIYAPEIISVSITNTTRSWNMRSQFWVQQPLFISWHASKKDASLVFKEAYFAVIFDCCFLHDYKMVAAVSDRPKNFKDFWSDIVQYILCSELAKWEFFSFFFF